jgi:hypothetical protein
LPPRKIRFQKKLVTITPRQRESMTVQIRDAVAPTCRVDRFPNHEQKQWVMLPIHTKLQVRTLTPCDHQTQIASPPRAAMSRIHRSDRADCQDLLLVLRFPSHHNFTASSHKLKRSRVSDVALGVSWLLGPLKDSRLDRSDSSMNPNLAELHHLPFPD